MMIMMLTLLLSVAVYGQDAHVMGHVKRTLMVRMWLV